MALLWHVARSFFSVLRKPHTASVVGAPAHIPVSGLFPIPPSLLCPSPSGTRTTPPAPDVFPPLPHVRPTPAGAERVAQGRGRVPLPEETLRCRPRRRLSRKRREGASASAAQSLVATLKSNVVLISIQIVQAEGLRDFLLEIIKRMEKTYKF